MTEWRQSKRWPRLFLARGARWPRGKDGLDLLARLNHAARLADTHVRITSGRRTAYEQWLAYQDYLSGGILAAPCCDRHWPHQWEQCHKQCASNHCVSRAVDCQVQRRHGQWVNAGQMQRFRAGMQRVGLCLPVGQGETWHVEVGDSWLS